MTVWGNIIKYTVTKLAGISNILAGWGYPGPPTGRMIWLLEDHWPTRNLTNFVIRYRQPATLSNEVTLMSGRLAKRSLPSEVGRKVRCPPLHLKFLKSLMKFCEICPDYDLPPILHHVVWNGFNNLPLRDCRMSILKIIYQHPTTWHRWNLQNKGKKNWV